jgi:hypothetical protein
MPPHLLLKDPACISAVAGLVRSIVTDWGDVPLDSSERSMRQVVFKNGMTVSFDDDFQSQVTPSMPEDRNSRQSPMPYIALDNDHVIAIGREVCAYLNKFTEAARAVEDDFLVVFADKFLDLMRAGKAPMFQHLYYETSGGRLAHEEARDHLFEAVYALRVDVGVISGMRADHEEYVLEWGPLGNNGKGQRRLLREHILGHSNRGKDRGYVSVISPSILKAPLDTSKACEDLAKLAFSREACVDDFACTDHPLCCSTLRALSGGGVMSANGKYEKCENFRCAFLIRMIVNRFPSWDEPLIGPDLRRCALIHYPVTYQAPDKFDEANPNHRPLIDFKPMIPEFAPEMVLWARVLAAATNAGHCKRMWPRPQSYETLLQEALEGLGGTEVDHVATYIRTSLRAVKYGEVPASRDAIVKDMSAKLRMQYFVAQTELRTRLQWTEKPWTRRVDGEFHKVKVFLLAGGEAVTLSEPGAPAA